MKCSLNYFGELNPLIFHRENPDKFCKLGNFFKREELAALKEEVQTAPFFLSIITTFELIFLYNWGVRIDRPIN